MPADKTEHFGNDDSWEDRIIDRLDAIDARLAALEAQAEERARETRPTWEKALAEIRAVNENVKELKGSVALLVDDVQGIRARQREAEIRLKEFESLLRRGSIS